MPRNARVDVGGEIYHVINRANGRLQIFNNNKDYKLFEQLLFKTKEIFDMRILAYKLMPNHFHLVLYPMNDGDLGLFMHRLSNAHTRWKRCQGKGVRNLSLVFLFSLLLSPSQTFLKLCLSSYYYHKVYLYL